MIIANGELWREEGAGGVTLDPETGYPVAPSTGWSAEGVACQVVPLSMDLRAVAREDGSPLAGAEFQVLVEWSDWVRAEGGKAGRVRVSCEELGLEGRELEVKSVKPLRAVEQVELIV